MRCVVITSCSRRRIKKASAPISPNRASMLPSTRSSARSSGEGAKPRSKSTWRFHNFFSICYNSTRKPAYCRGQNDITFVVSAVQFARHFKYLTILNYTACFCRSPQKAVHFARIGLNCRNNSIAYKFRTFRQLWTISFLAQMLTVFRKI